MFSDLPERGLTSRPPLEPFWPVSLLQKPQQSDTEVMGPLCVPGGTRTGPAQVTLPDVIVNPGQHTELREGFWLVRGQGTLYEGPFSWEWGHERQAVAASVELRGGWTHSLDSPLPPAASPSLHRSGQPSSSLTPTRPPPPHAGKVPPCPSSGHTGCCAFRGPSPSLC